MTTPLLVLPRLNCTTAGADLPEAEIVPWVAGLSTRSVTMAAVAPSRGTPPCPATAIRLTAWAGKDRVETVDASTT